MYTLKLCIVLTLLALMARVGSRFLLAGPAVNPALAQWIGRLHFHWIAAVWILYLLPIHPLSHLLAAGTLLASSRQVRQFPLVTLVFLSLGIPMLERRITGFPGIDSLFFFGWPLAVSLVVFALTRGNAGRWRDFPASVRTLFVVLFLFLFLLSFRGTSFTDGMRAALNYGALFFLTATVVCRSRAPDWIPSFIYALIAVGLLASFISVFESLRNWLLFADLMGTYGTTENHGVALYKYREGLLRSVGAQGNLQSGLILSSALIALVLIRRQLSGTLVFLGLVGVLAAGLLFTLSRGPVLVGLGVVLLFELFRSRASSIPQLAVFFGLAYGVLVFSGVIDLLQGMFQLQGDFNFNYRVRLFDASVDVILNHFLLGTQHFIGILAGQGLVQGEGIVDIVNTYLQIGLQFGGVALGVYALLMLLALRKAISRISTGQPAARGKSEDKVVGTVDVFWLALAACMVNVFVQSASVSLLGYSSLFALILVLVLMPALPLVRPPPPASDGVAPPAA
ncbi:MAG: hypothetical protein ACK40L_01600 [Hydrogenophaga sp.]